MAPRSHGPELAPSRSGRGRLEWRSVLLTLGVILAAAGSALATEETDGACLYRSYCAVCHGSSGRGDGPDAAAFTPPPTDLRKGFLRRYATEELVERVRAGGRQNVAFNPAALRAQATEVENLVNYLERLPTLDWGAIRTGEALFLCRCAECHGERGQPGATLPTGVQRPQDLSDGKYIAALDNAALIRLVRHGRKGMPALLPRVTEREAHSLVAYVRLFSTGFDRYSRYCANCHGEDGRGTSNASAVARPSVFFDKGYFDRVDPEHLRTRVWHMVAQHTPAMPHYRTELSAAQARAIIIYLQQAP